MKSKWYLISSVFQLIVGISAILSFIVLAADGENMTKWIITLLLSLAFVIIGIIGIKDYYKAKK